MALLFENETCSRCGGSGNHSYCQAYGTTCFKCLGRGRQLTKRGKVAQAFYQESLLRPATDVLAGEYVCPDKKWVRVLSVVDTGRAGGSYLKDGEWIEVFHLHFNLPRQRAYHTPIQSAVKSVRDQKDLEEKKAAALAYQESLTKAGKPRKVRAKKAA